ncbi:MAG: hypothetical protein KDK33_02400 [Leptospiraceae bacterium]|nr:hypothetical protein [Leptospiraceae bacterium]
MEQFAKLKSEAQSLSAGFVFSDRITYALFRAIQDFSTLDRARTRGVFTLDSPIPDIENLEYTKQELRAALIRLVEEGLAAQVFLIEHDAERRELFLRPCYVARPGNVDYSTEHIFEELMRQSASSIQSFIETLPPIDPEALREQLVRNSQSAGATPDSLGGNLLINPVKSIVSVSFDLLPPESLLSEGRKQIVTILKKRNAIIELTGLGYMPVRADDVQTRYEVAAAVLREKAIGLAGANTELINELMRVQREEESYIARSFVPGNTEYSVRRANLIKSHLSEPGESDLPYPGALACEIVLHASGPTQRLYTSKWEKEMDDVYSSILEPLRRPDVHPTQQIRYFNESMVDQIPGIVWQRLTTSPSLLFGEWETSVGTVRILMRKDANVVRHLVDAFAQLPASEQWKILALRNLIDAHPEVFQTLFQRKDFKDSYGQLLRTAYWPLIPWYIRLFLAIGFRGLQDNGFARAKAKIAEEQRDLAESNRRRRDAALLASKRARQSEPSSQRESANRMPIGKKLELVMDHLYFGQLKPPILPEVFAHMDGVSTMDLESHLSEAGYRFIPVEDGDMVLYPVDQEWRIRAARLRRVYENYEADPSDAPGIAGRVEALNKLLSRSFSEAQKAGRSSGHREEEPLLY